MVSFDRRKPAKEKWCGKPAVRSGGSRVTRAEHGSDHAPTLRQGGEPGKVTKLQGDGVVARVEQRGGGFVVLPQLG